MSVRTNTRGGGRGIYRLQWAGAREPRDHTGRGNRVAAPGRVAVRAGHRGGGLRRGTSRPLHHRRLQLPACAPRCGAAEDRRGRRRHRRRLPGVRCAGHRQGRWDERGGQRVRAGRRRGHLTPSRRGARPRSVGAHREGVARHGARPPAVSGGTARPAVRAGSLDRSRTGGATPVPRTGGAGLRRRRRGRRRGAGDPALGTADRRGGGRRTGGPARWKQGAGAAPGIG